MEHLGKAHYDLELIKNCSRTKTKDLLHDLLNRLPFC